MKRSAFIFVVWLALFVWVAVACDADPETPDAGANLCDELPTACETCSAADCQLAADAECNGRQYVPAKTFCATCHQQVER